MRRRGVVYTGLAAFGQFLIRWGRFEWQLAQAFSRVLGMPVQKGILIYFASGGNASRGLEPGT